MDEVLKRNKTEFIEVLKKALYNFGYIPKTEKEAIINEIGSEKKAKLEFYV